MEESGLLLLHRRNFFYHLCWIPCTGNYYYFWSGDDGRFVKAICPLSISVIQESRTIPQRADLVRKVTIAFRSRNYFLAGEPVNATARLPMKAYAVAHRILWMLDRHLDGNLARICVLRLNPVIHRVSLLRSPIQISTCTSVIANVL